MGNLLDPFDIVCSQTRPIVSKAVDDAWDYNTKHPGADPRVVVVLDVGTPKVMKIYQRMLRMNWSKFHDNPDLIFRYMTGVVAVDTVLPHLKNTPLHGQIVDHYDEDDDPIVLVWVEDEVRAFQFP